MSLRNFRCIVCRQLLSCKQNRAMVRLACSGLGFGGCGEWDCFEAVSVTSHGRMRSWTKAVAVQKNLRFWW